MERLGLDSANKLRAGERREAADGASPVVIQSAIVVIQSVPPPQSTQNSQGNREASESSTFIRSTIPQLPGEASVNNREAAPEDAAPTGWWSWATGSGNVNPAVPVQRTIQAAASTRSLPIVNPQQGPSNRGNREAAPD